jgi:hypothetical protein
MLAQFRRWVRRFRGGKKSLGDRRRSGEQAGSDDGDKIQIPCADLG